MESTKLMVGRDWIVDVMEQHSSAQRGNDGIVLRSDLLLITLKNFKSQRLGSRARYTGICQHVHVIPIFIYFHYYDVIHDLFVYQIANI